MGLAKTGWALLAPQDAKRSIPVINKKRTLFIRCNPLDGRFMNKNRSMRKLWIYWRFRPARAKDVPFRNSVHARAFAGLAEKANSVKLHGVSGTAWIDDGRRSVGSGSDLAEHGPRAVGRIGRAFNDVTPALHGLKLEVHIRAHDTHRSNSNDIDGIQRIRAAQKLLEVREPVMIGIIVGPRIDAALAEVPVLPCIRKTVVIGIRVRFNDKRIAQTEMGGAIGHSQNDIRGGGVESNETAPDASDEIP